jgi:hypothetical protein
MLSKAREIWQSIRYAVCRKRIYQYGTVALNYFDDRTPLEKFCDVVDNWFFERIQEQRYERHKSSIFHTNAWIDKLGNSSEKIKECENKGYAYASPREWEQAANKAKKRIDEESRKRFKNKIEFAVSEIKKGRKYTAEWNQTLQRMKKEK